MNPTVAVFLRWRAVVALSAISAVMVWLLVSKSFDMRLRLLIVAWFLLSIVPLSTFTLAVQSRKLYVTGPPLALLVSMSFVAFWDWLVSKLPPFSLERLDLRYVGFGLLVLLFVLGTPLWTYRMIDRPHMALASLTRIDDSEYRAMIDQIREEYPTVPEGVRLDLIGVPWSIRSFGLLDSRVVEAIWIYYGQIPVVGVESRADLPPPPPAGSYIVELTCPPVCGPKQPDAPPGAPRAK